MNRYFTEATGTERDFLLSALADGARIGYDASGTTWAVTDESAADLPEITFLDTPVIHAFHFALGAAEWKINTDTISTYFALEGNIANRIYRTSEGQWRGEVRLLGRYFPEVGEAADYVEFAAAGLTA